MRSYSMWLPIRTPNRVGFARFIIMASFSTSKGRALSSRVHRRLVRGGSPLRLQLCAD